MFEGSYSIKQSYNSSNFKNANEIISFNIIPVDTSLEITEFDVGYGNKVKVISDIAVNEGVVSISINSVNYTDYWKQSYNYWNFKFKTR